MHKNMRTIFAALLVLCLSAAPLVKAEELNARKKQLIDELLTITGALEITSMYADVYIAHMAELLQQSKPDLDVRAFDILREEVTAVIDEEMNQGHAINEISYPIYHKYLTIEDLQELIRFYGTPVGKKAVSVMPQITREAMIAGQQWGQQVLTPKIQQRIFVRFNKEGIAFP